MLKYIVIEFQQDANGQVANIVTAFDDRNQAESKYYTVLAAAAVSSVPCHTAMMVNNEGMVYLAATYKHGLSEEAR